MMAAPRVEIETLGIQNHEENSGIDKKGVPVLNWGGGKQLVESCLRKVGLFEGFATAEDAQGDDRSLCARDELYP